MLLGNLLQLVISILVANIVVVIIAYPLLL
jgi:hypothetical protein